MYLAAVAKLRSSARLLAVVALAANVLASAPVLAQAGDAKAALASADKAVKAKDWAKAQADFRAAHAATPSAQAVHGLGGASYELKAWAEAYEAYDEFLKSYKDAMGGGAKALAEKRVKELEAKTGAVTVLVNEAGAEVFLGDRKLGASPVRALVRVATGQHKVRVTKAGFAAFEKNIDVAASARVSVDVALTKEAKTGRLVVKESGGQAVRVIVDGVDMGPAPWEGELPPGPHDVSVRSATLGSTTQKIEVNAGKTAEAQITATSATGRIEIRTSDGLGNVYVDGKLVGEGSYAGEVPSGSHMVKVTREGFMPFEKTIDVADKQAVSETVTLRREGQSLEAVKVEEERPFYGLYGGFGLAGAAGLGGMGSSLEGDSCKTRGAVSCDTPGPLGGGAFGYVGFTWNPVGFELFLGGLFDHSEQKAEFAQPDPTKVALLGPSRTETFKVNRVGGVAALRVRATYDAKVVRLSLAAGPGIAYKVLILEREATTPTGFSDRYVPDDGKTNAGETEANKLSYLGPALSGDVAMHIRIGSTVAVSLGALAWLESAGTEVVAQGDKNRYMVNSAQQGSTPIALRTPSYQPTVGTQFFLGPYLGMQFGP